jgi:hypothetical protein
MWKLGAFWLRDATDFLLDLKLIRTYFDPRQEVNRYVNTWTYIGKLVIKRMEPNFPPISSGDAEKRFTVITKSQEVKAP